MNSGFILKATGVIFRESFEAVLFYGIIVSYLKQNNHLVGGVRAAKIGFGLGVIVSGILGLALTRMDTAFSSDVFSNFEIVVLGGGSLMMLYMVFWMNKKSKTLKKEFEKSLDTKGRCAIAGTVFVAMFREGFECFIYLYSLSFEFSSEKTELGLRSTFGSNLILSFAIGLLLSYFVYQLILRGSSFLSTKIVLRATGVWLLLSSCSLLQSAIDKIFAVGYFAELSPAVIKTELPSSISWLTSFLEVFVGIRFEPSSLHLIVFFSYWALVLYKNPLDLFGKKTLF